MAYNFAGLKEAISAAAAAQRNDGMEEEHNFLHRLHLHSARLNENDAPPPSNNGQCLLFSSPTNCADFEAEKTQSFDCDQDDRIAIELSPVSVDTLNELFGDGQGMGECSDTGVNLPIWLCDLLYKAIQKMPIANSLREEFELQNDATIVPKKCRRDKNISLKRLYEMFPSLPKKLINRVAKEMDYDYDQTALYLVRSSDDDPIDPGSSADDRESVSIIVPSLCPRVIKQQLKTNTHDNNTSNFLLVQDVENELRKMAAEQKHCKEMKTKYVGFGNANICGFYIDRARQLESARKALTEYWDGLRIWKTSSEECIDLHQLGAERALATVVQKINICREMHPNIRKLHVITGYGKTTGTPVIKPRLLAFLKGKGMEARVSPKNLGVVEISLGSVSQHIDYP
uniref:Smr domain-containing protein n=1 Tax=Globodera rostochiensis TaxID=31243 RepID=A0A914H2Y3_GLORO